MKFFEDVRIGEVRDFGRHTFTAEDIAAFAARYDHRLSIRTPHRIHIIAGFASEALRCATRHVHLPHLPTRSVIPRDERERLPVRAPGRRVLERIEARRCYALRCARRTILDVNASDCLERDRFAIR